MTDLFEKARVVEAFGGVWCRRLSITSTAMALVRIMYPMKGVCDQDKRL
jgi:hypothetical protein